MRIRRNEIHHRLHHGRDFHFLRGEGVLFSGVAAVKIALLTPTRARPEQLNRMMKSAVNTAEKANIDFYIASTDGIDNYDFPNLKTPDGMPTAFKWNLLAEEAMKDPENKLFMLASDDIIFSTPMWDSWLIEDYCHLENKIHVYHLQDSRDKNGTPHPIFSREWIEAMGYMVHPLFLHWQIDTWAVEIAKYCGCFTYVSDYLLQHIKPSDQGNPDATHTGIRQMGWHTRDAWTAERCKYLLEFEKQRMYKHFSQAARIVA